ncbi:MAG: hypothetical protein H6813_02135 [Phycisphaeraceae bacterium]|nr:hypothetical protein [Phycisphaeraceae bacterium]
MAIKDGEYDTGSGWKDPGMGGGFGGGAGGGGPGGGDSFRRILGRIFGDAEHPLGWGVTLGRLFGVRIRLHLLLIVYALGQIAWSIPRDELGVAYMAMLMGSMLLVVFLHDMGHVAMCRRLGGEADDALLWPLGGLAPTLAPEGWKPKLLIALAGPMVNVVIAIGTTIGLVVAGREDMARVPLRLGNSFSLFDGYAIAGLWALHYVNLIVLAANTLLPMRPLDAAEVLHAILWRKSGDEHQSAELTATTGIAVGVGVAALALVAEMTLLLGVAVFGILMSWSARQRLRMVDEVVGEAWRASLREETGAGKGASPDAAKLEAQRKAEVDRLLAKIAEGGMDSLTRKERKTLRMETEARKREQ